MYEIYRKLRDKKNLRDSDVAKATNIANSTFSDWKSGRSKPKNEKLQKIADYLGVSVDYLATGIEKYQKEWETGSMLGDIASDSDLQEVIKKYMALSDKNKTLVRSLIQSLSK